MTKKELLEMIKEADDTSILVLGNNECEIISVKIETQHFVGKNTGTKYSKIVIK